MKARGCCLQKRLKIAGFVRGILPLSQGVCTWLSSELRKRHFLMLLMMLKATLWSPVGRAHSRRDLGTQTQHCLL